MTSSAASETDSARKRTGLLGAAINGAQRRSTSTPPPPGRCTSSRTTSGRVAGDDGDRLVDVAGLADDLDARALGPPDLRLDSRAEHPVVVDEDHPDPPSAASAVLRRAASRRPLPAVVVGHDSAALSISSSTSVPPPGDGPQPGRAAVALHAADDRLSDAHPVLGHRVQVEARARGPARTRRPSALDLREDLHGAALATVLGGVDHRLARGLDLCGQPLVERAVADDHDLHRDAVVVLDLGGGRLDGLGEGVGLARPRPCRCPRACRASCAARAPGRGRGGATSRASSALRWIRVRVCSTESWTWAATSARSWARMRISRSSERSCVIRTRYGPGQQRDADEDGERGLEHRAEVARPSPGRRRCR